jgi:undecaprenyl-diphosphatase
MGTGAALFGVMLAASGLLWAHRRGFLLPPLWLAYLGAEATTWGTKFLVDRHRPVFIEAASASSPSFPSAHSAGAMLVWGFLAYLVARELPTSGQRRAAIATAAILLALIGFSRIFLSVHYLSDVLGGYLLSAFWLAVGIDLAERARPR